jgi:phage tail-like protein
MMRGHVPDLDTPHPIGFTLPALYQDDEFTQRLCGALDEVLAPVFGTLDCLDSYFDPRLTPDDFLEWLSTWVGFALDEKWSVERSRSLVAHAVQLYRWRGTVRGMAEAVEILTGSVPEIVENGGVSHSRVPGGPLPGSEEPFVRVRVAVQDPRSVDVARLNAIVEDTKPAHVPHSVEVLQA